jgi:hypothetical protein
MAPVNKLRTAPLWGLRTRSHYMHDLASQTLENAVRPIKMPKWAKKYRCQTHLANLQSAFPAGTSELAASARPGSMHAAVWCAGLDSSVWFVLLLDVARHKLERLVPEMVEFHKFLMTCL